jgi:hypothetical protein
LLLCESRHLLSAHNDRKDYVDRVDQVTLCADSDERRCDGACGSLTGLPGRGAGAPLWRTPHLAPAVVTAWLREHPPFPGMTRGVITPEW